MGSSCLGKSDGDIYVLNPMDKAENRLMAIVNAGFDRKIKIIQHPSNAFLLKLLNAIPQSAIYKFLADVNFAIFQHDPCCGFDRAKNFVNWGKTVDQVYDQILYPGEKDPYSVDQIKAIQNFVKQKVNQGKRIRGAGIRHSWGNIFADKDQCLVSFYPYRVAKGTSRIVEQYAVQMNKINKDLNYKGKQFLGTIKKLTDKAIIKDGKAIHLVKIGAGVSNDQLRRWCIQNKLQYKSNVIMVEVNVCGGLGTCSHGAGIGTQTLADYIYEIQFIDYRGVKRTITKTTDPNNKDWIKSAASSLGLLGLMVFITMEMEELQIIKSQPRKLFKDFVIPWPKEEAEHRKKTAKASRQWALYLDLDQNIKGKQQQRGERKNKPMTPENKSQLTQYFFGQNWQNIWKDNVNKFKEAINKTYCQWFYFPIQQVHVFQNVWTEWKVKTYENIQKVQTQQKGEFINDYPPPYLKALSQFALFTGNILNNHILTHSAVNILMRVPYLFFPHKHIFMNYVDGVHFQRGIQNMRVRDFQVQINVPNLNGKDQIDYNFIQKIWWASKDIVEKNKELVNIALEMRIFKGSQATLAPQYGYQYVCSIQILRTMTLSTVQQENWRKIIVETFNAWKNIKDSNGDQMTIRPHWGKEWNFIPEIKNHIFQQKKMKQNIRKFMGDYKNICQYLKIDYKQNIKTFSNDLYKEMINNAVDEEDRIN